VSIIDTYTNILAFIGLKVSEDGFILYPDDKPVYLDNKPLALPTKDILALHPDKRIIFHLALEEINKGESKLFTFYRELVNKQLNYLLFKAMLFVGKIAATTEIHSKLSGDQLNHLEKLNDVDGKFVDLLTKIWNKAKEKESNLIFINVYIKRGGTKGDKKYSRLGVVTSHICDLIREDKVPYNIPFRKKDKESLLNLYNVILPKPLGEYNYGSNSYVAPNLSSLLYTAKNILDDLNSISTKFSGLLSDELSLISTEFLDDLDLDSDAFILEVKRIPMQNGNQGIIPSNVNSVNNAPTSSANNVSNSDTISLQQLRDHSRGLNRSQQVNNSGFGFRNTQQNSGFYNATVNNRPFGTPSNSFQSGGLSNTPNSFMVDDRPIIL
jgi:hypothetical protein